MRECLHGYGKKIQISLRFSKNYYSLDSSNVFGETFWEIDENPVALIDGAGQLGYSHGNRQQERREPGEDERADETTGYDVDDVMAPDNDARENDASGPENDPRLSGRVSGEVLGAEVEEEKRRSRRVTCNGEMMMMMMMMMMMTTMVTMVTREE